VVRRGSVDDITGRKERDRSEKNATKSEVNYLVIVGIHDMTAKLVLCLQIRHSGHGLEGDPAF